MADFSVIIPAFNEGERLEHTMRSVAHSLTDKYKAEILVVDDCSTDDTLDVAKDVAVSLHKRYEMRVEAIAADQRLGVGPAKNLGQEEASTGVSVFLDAHAVPGRGALEAIVTPLMHDGDIVLTTPNAVGLPNPEQEEYVAAEAVSYQPEQFILPAVKEYVTSRGLACAQGMRIENIDMQLKWMHPPRITHKFVRVQVVPGGCMGVRTKGWGNMPYEGFDDGLAFPWGAEDAEISLRAWRLGFTAVALPRTYVAIHYRDRAVYGVPGLTVLFNALRLAMLYLSDDVIEKVLDHYRDHPERDWAITQLLLHSDVADRRRELDQMGPERLRDMLPVFYEFGGLDVSKGPDRRIVRGGAFPRP